MRTKVRLRQLEKRKPKNEPCVISSHIKGGYNFNGTPCATLEELERLEDEFRAAHPNGTIIQLMEREIPIPNEGE